MMPAGRLIHRLVHSALLLITCSAYAQQPDRMLIQVLQENRTLRIDLQKAEERGAALQGQVQEWRDQNVLLQEQATKSIAEKSMLQEQLGQLQKTNAELSLKARQLLEQNTALHEKIERLQTERENMPTDEGDMENQHAQSEQSKQELQPPGQSIPVAAAKPAPELPPVTVAPVRITDQKPVTPGASLQPLNNNVLQAETSAYRNAIRSLGEKPAVVRSVLTNFLNEYGNGHYGGEINFWLAESYYETAEYSEARQYYERVVKDFPQSEKISAARLKIAYIYYADEQWGQARVVLEALLQSDDEHISRLAEKRLQRMNREGR